MRTYTEEQINKMRETLADAESKEEVVGRDWKNMPDREVVKHWELVFGERKNVQKIER